MNPTPLNPAERVALLIKKLDVTTYQFGKATGISHQTLSNVLTGKNKPGLDTLQAIAAVYPAAAIFLLTGLGEPFPDGVRGASVPALNPNLDFAPATPVATEPNATRGQVVEHADTVLRLAETEQKLIEVEKELSGTKSENNQLTERLRDAKEEILWLRGKSPASSDAANPTTLAPLPAPNAIGYHACAKRRAAEFDEYVQVRQEEGGVAELV